MPDHFKSYRSTGDRLNEALKSIWEDGGQVSQVIHTGGRDYTIVYVAEDRQR